MFVLYINIKSLSVSFRHENKTSVKNNLCLWISVQLMQQLSINHQSVQTSFVHYINFKATSRTHHPPSQSKCSVHLRCLQLALNPSRALAERAASLLWSSLSAAERGYVTALWLSGSVRDQHGQRHECQRCVKATQQKELVLTGL